MNKLSCVLLLALAACEDDPVAAPTLGSSVPANGARGVDVLVVPTVTLAGEVDAASVSASLATLDGVPARGTVSYDAASRTVTFAPTYGLLAGQEYALSVSATGLSASVSFTVASRPLSRGVSYTGGVVSSWEENAFDAAGDLVRRIQYNGAGTDGEWLTADDAIRRYSTREYDSAGNALRVTTYSGAGGNGTWLDDDDVIANYLSNTFNAYGLTRSVTYISSTNGTWHDDDDQVGSWLERTFTSRGRPERDVSYFDAGDDNTWFTADDVPDRETVYRWDEQNRALLLATRDAGDDGELMTADDTWFAIGWTYDAEGELSGGADYDGPGADGEWLTADDSIGFYRTTAYDLAAGTYRETAYDGPGGDGDWRTNDDEIAEYYTGTLVERDLIGEMWTYGAGQDGIWMNEDDEPTYRWLSVYDAGGNLVSHELWESAGDDGDWSTADDVYAAHNVYDQAY
jgi:hypothetical protein